jgi:hypothetical protein
MAIPLDAFTSTTEREAMNIIDIKKIRNSAVFLGEPADKVVIELCDHIELLQASEPVAKIALLNTHYISRIKVLEDLLSSAYSIANRYGEDTHWLRFAQQLHINGISPITPKTFKILPSDEGYTSPPNTQADEQVKFAYDQLTEEFICELDDKTVLTIAGFNRGKWAQYFNAQKAVYKTMEDAITEDKILVAINTELQAKLDKAREAFEVVSGSCELTHPSWTKKKLLALIKTTAQQALKEIG